MHRLIIHTWSDGKVQEPRQENKNPGSSHARHSACGDGGLCSFTGDGVNSEVGTSMLGGGH